MSLEEQLERSLIVAFVRRRTNLGQLADLLAAGGHRFTEATLEAWCTKHGAMLRPREGGK